MHYSPLAITATIVLIIPALPAQVQWSAAVARPNSGTYAHDSLRARTVFYGSGQTWEFDGTNWHRRSPVNSPGSAGGTMAFDASRGCIVLAGFTMGTWEWDGIDWTQRSTSAASGSMCYDAGRQRVVSIGSYFANPWPIWEWDGATWSQTTSLTGPPARYRTTVAYDNARQRLVLFGGVNDTNPFNPQTYFADTWEWVGGIWTQASPTTAPPARGSHTMAFDATRQRVVMAGGASGQGWIPPTSHIDCWEWDGVNWVASAPIPVAGTGHSLVATPQSPHLYASNSRRSWARNATNWFGQSWPPPAADQGGCFDSTRGRMVTTTGYLETWEWDGANWWHAAPAVGPSTRIGHEIVFDETRGRSVLFGGLSGTLRNDTWEWDGTTWQLQPPGPAPIPRRGHAMAYDSGRQRVVLFGGSSAAGLLGDTWEWDGAGWIASFPMGAPSPRSDGAMAYDAARGRVLLFGGRDLAAGALDDTWEWNGTAWALQAVAVRPPARDLHAMAYNVARQRIELFGGRQNGLTTSHGDTWEWDGVTWSQRTTPNPPPPRHSHSLVYDATRQHTLMAGPDESLWTLSPIPASATPFGSGCGSPPLTLVPDPTGRPVLGQVARATLTNAPTPLAAIAMGWSKDFFGPYPLPVTLTGIGMTGCTLYQSSDVLGLGLVPTNPTTLSFAMTIPNQSSLLGASVFLQSYGYAPAANALEFVSSNALEWLMNNL